MVSQRLVRPDGVVFFDVPADQSAQLSRRFVFVGVQPFHLQAVEPTLDHDVVRPAALAIHALADVQVEEKLLVLVAGELASLVGVQNGRQAVCRHGFPHSMDDRGRVERVRQVRPDDLPAAPVDERRKVHVAALHRDIGDVDRPDLVREFCFVIPQQIRHDGLFEIPPGKIGLRVNGVDAHLFHEPPHGLAADAIALLLQFHDELARAEIRMLGVPIVDALHEFLLQCQIGFVQLFRLVVQAGAVDVEQVALSPDGKLLVSLLEHIPGGRGWEFQLVESSPEESRAPASAGRWS